MNTKSKAKRLRTLLPMAVDGVGPSFTCVSLLNGMKGGGFEPRLYINRNRAALPGLEVRRAVPRFLAALPYRAVRGWAKAKTEAAYLRDLRPDDVAYLWPEASLAVHRAVSERGVPIVLEGINTRMAHARAVLDRAYAREGLAPLHGITDERIAQEEEKLSLARAMFAPSPGVEAALADAPLPPDGVIPASYGVALAGVERSSIAQRDPPVVLFVGFLSVRKGGHHLLRAWQNIRTKGRLVIAGNIEPAVITLCGDILNRDDVETVGFVRDVDRLYRQADLFVLPSYEEGDPLVTYEAAARGLPVVASPMGAGRMGAATDAIRLIDPDEPQSLEAALAELLSSPEDRRMWGEQAHAAVQDYDWAKVGARRAEKLHAVLEHGR